VQPGDDLALEVAERADDKGDFICNCPSSLGSCVSSRRGAQGRRKSLDVGELRDYWRGDGGRGGDNGRESVPQRPMALKAGELEA